jgi:hypothetical protein
MTAGGEKIPYRDLVALTDSILDECDEDVALLARRIGGLDAVIRDELLVSDLLNAYQVFYYFFRIDPDELVKERLELEPASALIYGIKLHEIDLLDLVFLVKNKEPLIVISDGEKEVAVFSGRSAYTNGLNLLQNPGEYA